jgi:hypothetical protein
VEDEIEEPVPTLQVTSENPEHDLSVIGIERRGQDQAVMQVCRRQGRDMFLQRRQDATIAFLVGDASPIVLVLGHLVIQPGPNGTDAAGLLSSLLSAATHAGCAAVA